MSGLFLKVSFSIGLPSAEGSPIENDTFKNNPDKEYVVFCGLGGQGTLATKTMKEMGIKNVKNITGGMSEWDKLKD